MIFDFPCICRPTSKHVRVRVYHFSINLSRDFHLFFHCFFADIFYTESLRILAECLFQSETQLPLRQICYYSPPKEVGVFSTEIKTAAEHLVFNGPCILRRILFHTWFTVCPSLSCFLFTQSAAYPRQSSLPAYLFAVKPYSAKKESASSVPR